MDFTLDLYVFYVFITDAGIVGWCSFYLKFFARFSDPSEDILPVWYLWSLLLLIVVNSLLGRIVMFSLNRCI